MGVNFTLQETPENRKPSVFAASFLYLLAMMGLWIAPFVAYPVNFILVKLAPGFGEAAQRYVAQAMYYALFLLLPVYSYTRMRPSCHEHMRISPLSGKKALLIVAAACVGALLLNYITTLWAILIEAFGGRLTQSSIIVPDSPSGMVPAILFVAVLPGIAEELLFRGVMLGAWEEKGSLRAIGIVSLWFAMLHSSIEGFPAEFISGLILGFVVVSTSSLFAGMIYHTVHNALCLIIAYAAAGGAEPSAAADSVRYFDAIGGIGGVFELLMYILFAGALLLYFLRKLDMARIREKRLMFGVKPMPPREIGVSETMVIASCIVVGGLMYFVSLLEIAGVLG